MAFLFGVMNGSSQLYGAAWKPHPTPIYYQNIKKRLRRYSQLVDIFDQLDAVFYYLGVIAQKKPPENRGLLHFCYYTLPNTIEQR